MEMQNGSRLLNLLQGEFRVTSDWRLSLSTVLGSCVSVCLLDPVAGVAGMNHFLLPNSPYSRMVQDARYGDYSMRTMIATMLSRGATIENMQAKIYGGASTLTISGDVGERNVEFAYDYLDRSRIPVFGGCVGSDLVRRITFVPGDGDVILQSRSVTPANTPQTDRVPSRFVA
jgi:chemotaxis protein CheD